VPGNADGPAKAARAQRLPERSGQPITGIGQHAAEAHPGGNDSIDLLNRDLWLRAILTQGAGTPALFIRATSLVQLSGRNMRNLHGGGRTGDDDNLVAPVELISFARRKTQQHISRCGHHRALPVPCRSIPPYRVVAAAIAEPLQLLEHPDHRQPLAPRLAPVRLQKPVQLARPRPQLRQRLHAALIGKRRLVRP